MHVQHIELMNYYDVHTYLTLSKNPILVSLWKEVVPKHAFKHPFLLQGLLAIAAQHKLHHDKNHMESAVLIDTANRYQQEALATYIHLLNDITEDNCHALFAFSQVIVLISYSRLSLGIHEGSGPHSLIAGVVDIFDLLKGTFAIAHQASTWLHASDLAPMMGDMPTMPLRESLSASRAPCTQALSALSDHITSQMSDSFESRTRVESLLSTIQLLYTILLEDPRSVNKLNTVGGFPVWVDANYIRLLKEQDHASLTILAYYGIALHQIRQVWCLDGVEVRIVQAVADLVSHQWSTYLLWPQAELGGEG